MAIAGLSCVHDGVFGDVTVAFLRLVVLLGDGDVVDYARIDGISIGMSKSPRLFSPERAARVCRDFCWPSISQSKCRVLRTKT